MDKINMLILSKDDFNEYGKNKEDYSLDLIRDFDRDKLKLQDIYDADVILFSSEKGSRTLKSRYLDTVFIAYKKRVDHDIRND